MSFIVAIDGPAGSGKGTVTKVVAEKIGLVNIDTGIIYRCIALATLKNNIKVNEIEKILELMENIDIQIKYQGSFQYAILNGEDVTKEIRTKEVNEIVSYVSTPPEIREKVTKLERKIGNDNLQKGKSIIMEGRDITTVVFPEADVKIYLDATPEERAKRRYKQNQEIGLDIPFEEILQNIKERDYNDMTKKIGALKIAKDAIYIDTSNIEIDDVIDKICEIIKGKI